MGGTKTGSAKDNSDSAGDVRGPSNCASRQRAEDAAEAVKDMAALMNRMDPELVQRLVTARDAAAGIHLAFPGGDQRFKDAETESEYDAEGEGEDLEEEVELEGEASAEAEECRGLLDEKKDPGPEASLKRAKEEYDFDIVKEMDTANLDFFDRIRVTNYIRKLVMDGAEPHDAVSQFRRVLNTTDAAVLGNDALLEPVVEGDMILTVLESESPNEEDRQTEELSDAVQQSLKDSDVLR